MAESYSLEAILSARDTNFTSTMNNAQKAMGGLGKSTSGIGASIGKIAAGFGVFKAISGTISLLSSGFSSLTSELNESSIAWQTFESNMAMLGKSSGEIDSTRKSLEQFAQQTIYSASDMASTYSQMAAIGVDDTEKLVKAMGGLAASAENPQQAMKTLSQQMTQAMTKPTLRWEDFKLMLEQTPAGMAEVAKEMGYALDDFVVAVQDGEIASKDFAKAVSEVGTNEHFGSMATEFKSVGQAMDGARETIANKLMPAFEMLSAIGIKAISSLTDWIDTLDFSGLLAPIESLASMFGIATDEITAMTDTIKMSSDEIQSVADNWETMTLAEKQATVQTMGQEDLSELLEMLGVDFESIPDEYTKDAFLNTHGKDALEEILWVTGKWHDLTLEEKRAVLEAQIENKPLEEAIDSMGLWEDAEFVSKFAEINMNDNDSGQQVLDLINYYRELDGQEPIELEVDAKTKPAEKAINKFAKSYKKFGKSIGKITKGFAKEFVKSGARLERSTVNLKRGFDNAFESFQNGDYERGIFTLGNSLATFFQDGINNAGFTLAGIFDTINASYSYEDWQSIGKDIGDLISGGLKLFFENDFEFDFSGIQTALNSLDLLMEEALNGLFDGLLESIGLEGEIADIENFLNGVTFEGDLSAWAESIKLAFQESFADWDWNILLPEFAYTDLKGNRWELDWNKAIERMVSGFGDSPIDETIVMFELVPEIRTGDFNTDFREEFASKFDSDMYTEQEIDVITSYVIDDEGNLNAELVAMMEALGLDPQQVTVPTTVDFILENWEELGLYDVIQEILGGGTPDFEVEYTVPVKPEVEVIEPDSDWRNYFEDNPMGEVQGSADLKIIPTSTTVTPTGQPTFDAGGVDLSAETSQKATIMTDNGELKVAELSMDENNLPVIDPIDVTNELSLTGTAEPPQIDFSGMISDANSAMQQVNQAITAGMTNVASAVRMGTVMMNVAFRSGMNQAIITAQNTANRVVSVFSNLSSRLHSAGMMAGAGFRNGLASQSSSIISTAQSIANSVSNTIQSALRIASPSKVTTYLGEMVGAGLIAGMDGMVAGVESSANRLSLATLPVTDLGSTRYSGSISGQSTSSKLDEVIDAINRGQVIMMDSGALVGETSKQMDVALGQRGSLGGRHKL